MMFGGASRRSGRVTDSYVIGDVVQVLSERSRKRGGAISIN
jgi:hypothetical protein